MRSFTLLLAALLLPLAGTGRLAAESGDGLWGSYYPNMTLADDPVVERIDAQVDFNWGSGSPDGSLPVDHFSVRWEGWVVPDATGPHTFYVRTDDGVRLHLGGDLVVDQWRNQGPTEKAATVMLQAGEPVPVTIEYYENGGGAVAGFRWLPPGGAKELVPQRVLYTEPPTVPTPPTGGLLGHYFDNSDLYGEPVLVQLDAEPQFEWGSESPGPTIPADDFSVRWLGTVTAPVAGTYTFATHTDDGALVWINGKLIVDDWVTRSATRTATFQGHANQKIPIRVCHYENTGGARAKLYWESDSRPRQLVPQDRLYPELGFGVVLPTASATSPVCVEGAVPDGRNAEVVAEADGAPLPVTPLAKNSFFIEVPLAAETATAVGMALAGADPFVGAIAWTPTPLDDDGTMIVRTGDSLLIEANPGDELTVYLECGVVGTPVLVPPSGLVPVAFGVAGNYIVQDSAANQRSVLAISADYPSPVACEVGFNRTLGVPAAPDGNHVWIGAADATELWTANDGYDAEEGDIDTRLRAEKRGSPVMLARLIDKDGPILWYKGVDEFTVVTTAHKGTLINDDQDAGESRFTMVPYIPGVRFDFHMFASKSTFQDGATDLSVNSSDVDPATGEPLWAAVHDPDTTEVVGVYYLTIEVPDNESAYCFTYQPLQTNDEWVPIGKCGYANGHVCKAKSLNTLTYMRSTTDEVDPTGEKIEGWAERNDQKFRGVEECGNTSGCDCEYEVVIKEKKAANDPKDEPKTNARYKNESVVSNEEPCDNACGPIDPEYTTGTKFGLYDKILREAGASGGKPSGTLWVGRLDTSGKESGTLDMFPQAICEIPQRSGVLVDAQGRKVDEPVIIVLSGGEKVISGGDSQGTKQPSFYGVDDNNTNIWSFKAKDDGFEQSTYTRRWYLQNARDLVDIREIVPVNSDEVKNYEIPVGRWYIRLVYRLGSDPLDPIIAEAAIRSIVVEEKHCKNVTRSRGTGTAKGTQAGITGKCHSDIQWPCTKPPSCFCS